MLLFPKTLIGRMAWVSSACAAVTACALMGLTVQEAAPVVFGGRAAQDAGPSRIGPPSAQSASKRAMAAELTDAVRVANELSAAKCGELVDYWRAELRDARNPARVRRFVGELTGIAQKFHQGVGFLDGQAGHRSVLAAFREMVVDERRFVADLQATVAGYERFLAEQDRQLLQAAGVSDARHALVAVTVPTYAHWSDALRRVVGFAANEARRDMGRFAASWVASDLGGDGVRRMMRTAGIDKSKPGSWGDLILGFTADVGVGVVIDRVTDPTERIVSRLGQEMVQVEQTLLDGDHGLVGQLRQIKSFHEQARAEFLATAEQH